MGHLYGSGMLTTGYEREPKLSSRVGGRETGAGKYKKGGELARSESKGSGEECSRRDGQVNKALRHKQLGRVKIGSKEARLLWRWPG